MTDFCWKILLAEKIGQLRQSSDIHLEIYVLPQLEPHAATIIDWCSAMVAVYRLDHYYGNIVCTCKCHCYI